MNRIVREIHIDAPVDRVWAELDAFGDTYRWNPNVVTSHSTSEAPTGLDATRHCDLTLPGATLEERIIGYVPGESLAVSIEDGTRTPPFEHAHALMSVRPDDGGTTFRVEFDYALRFGVVGAALNKAMVASQMTKSVELILAGLKHHVETGEPIDGSVRIDTSAVAAA